jgi:hypothetical protein
MQTGILDDGGLSVTNTSSGTISSNNGINAGGTANVTNFGTITGQHSASTSAEVSN